MSVESEGEGLDLTGKIRLDTSELDSAVAKVQTQLTSLNDGFLTAGKGVGLSVLTDQALQLTAALAPAANLVLTLPGILSVAALALGTTAIATHGLGQAFTDLSSGNAAKFNDDLQQLSPNAAAFTKEAAALSGQLQQLQRLVQNDFFAGLDNSAKKVVTSDLPILEVGLGAVATSLNAVIKSAADAVASPFFQGKLTAVFAEAAGTTSEFSLAIGPLLDLFINLAADADPVIERFADWSTNLLIAKAATADTAAGTEKLTSDMNKGADVLSQVFNILVLVAKGLGNVVDAAANPAMLDNLTKMADQFDRWSESAQGQQQLATIFKTLQEISSDMAQIVPVVAKAFSDLFNIVQSLPAPLKDGVEEFAALLILFPGITTAAAGMLGVFGGLIGVMAEFGFAEIGVTAGLAAIGVVAVEITGEFAKAKTATDNFLTSINAGKSVDLGDINQQATEIAAKLLAVQDAGATTLGGWIKERAELSNLRQALADTSADYDKMSQVYLEVTQATGLSQQAVEDLAKSQNLDLNKSVADLSGQLAGAFFDLNNNSQAVNTLWQEQQTLASKTSTTTEKMNAFKDALNNALGVTLTAQQGNLDLANDVANLKDKYDAAKGSTDLNTQAGRDLEGALLDVTKQIEGNADALAASGDIQDTASAKQAYMLSQLQGLQKTYPTLAPLIQTYIDKINTVPTGVTTTMTADTDAAKARLDTLKAELIDLTNPNKWTITIDPTNGRNTFIPNLDSGLPGHATGGFATGSFIAGEHGAEIVNVGGLPAQVFNNTDTKRMLGSGDGSGVSIGQIVLQGVTDAASVRSALPDLIDAIRTGVGARSGS